MLSSVAKEAKNYNVMVLSDYGKGTLSEIESLIDIAKNNDMNVLVDPKGKNFSRYHGSTMLTPNFKEFQSVVGNCKTDDEIKEKALELITSLDLIALLITRSEDGMTMVLKDKTIVNLPTSSKSVVNVSGAGDTVIAVMALALSSGHDFKSSMYLANFASGIVVSKEGTSTLSANELYDASSSTIPINEKIIPRNQINSIITEARKKGEKIVMTNGCFDILHAGHVEYLQKARALGDRLLVAVNNDLSVQRLKGKTRPIVPLDSRMTVLSALSCIDWLVEFDEDTPVILIQNILPDFLVKGDDYEIHEIAGHEAVLGNGGQVKTLQLTPNKSTTSIINKIRLQQM